MGLTEHESIIQMIRTVANEQTSMREGLRTCPVYKYQDSRIKVNVTRFTHDIEVYVVIDRKTDRFVFKTERWWSEDGESFKEYQGSFYPGLWLDHLKWLVGATPFMKKAMIKKEEYDRRRNRANSQVVVFFFIVMIFFLALYWYKA